MARKPSEKTLSRLAATLRKLPDADRSRVVLDSGYVPEISEDDAIRALTRNYMSEIRRLAIEALKIEDEEARETWLHETIDGHHDVIYTYAARRVMVCTENPDAHEDEMGEPAPSVEVAAYWAMRADVNDLLGNSYFVAEHAPKADPVDE